ncbi:MAG TPA: hypothetical protein VGO53_09640 [Steroidobacteraceae bacterium]|nr:hypothetical protein [Steroidobacteraceae bacterium]
MHATATRMLYRLLGASQICAPEWLEDDVSLEEVRVALDWCSSPGGDASLGVKLTAASAAVWFESSLLDEYRERLEDALQVLNAMPSPDPALELQLRASLGDALMYTTGCSPRVTAAFNRTLQLAEQLGTTVHHKRALCCLWAARIGAADYESAIGFAEAFGLVAGSSGDVAAVSLGDRMMAVAHHSAGSQVIARSHAERALSQPHWAMAPLNEGAFRFEPWVAGHAVFARILWVQGFPDQAVRSGREALDRARSTGHALSLCYALPTFCTLLLLTGELPEAKRHIALLLELSARHSLFYWHFWGRCLEVALVRQNGETRTDHPVLRDPMCGPVHKEVLATLSEGLTTRDAIVRAENGLSGWCAAELMRVRAERLLKDDGANAVIAEEILQHSLVTARQQGARAWELRTATSLARLWHEQHRSAEAHDLLTPVYEQFTEGFATPDLVKAKTLLARLPGRLSPASRSPQDSLP